jgi:uncharacterized metal-binding protein
MDSAWVTLASLSFVFATFFLSPDLDLKHSIPTKNWGALSWIWCAYPYFFKHRGKSHSLFLSSFTRIFYLVIVFGIGFFLFHFVKEWTENHVFREAIESTSELALSSVQNGSEWINDHQHELFAVLTGIVMSDWIHIFIDRLFSFFKRIV